MSGSTRRFEVKPLSRVEGEGALRVRVDGERVEVAEFNIYEPPRFFERILLGREVHEVPDITARICGICPVAYQMSSCHALEKALGVEVTPGIRTLRRLLYCGEWIQSHALHIHLLHAPDFLGYDSGFTMAAEFPELVENGLRLKAIGNRLLELLGGRAVHPINVTVGGFYKTPSAAAIRGMLPDLEWGLATSLELAETVAHFEFPRFSQRYECVALRHADEYPMNEGLIVAEGGPAGPLEIPVEDYDRHFAERHVPQSTALHSVRLPGETAYLTGPISRLNLCREQLPPRSAEVLDRLGLEWPLANAFESIIARAVEMAAAFEIASTIAADAATEISPSRVPYEPRSGEGCHATEAPRGLLYHRYRLGEDGLVAAAEIVPPTSQNQARIEADLLGLLPEVLALDDAAATQRCEALIRSYDPCISCATHFLTLSVERPGRS